ncbi:MAG: neutral/alkaline non-lysosomal ceramidase N-terminal domain-containing protein [Spirochaetota bacterium]
MGLRAAGARVDITPPVGTELSGWCFGPSRGIADRLYARALVLDDGHLPMVIITADLIGLGTQYAVRIREKVARCLGTTRARVLVSCSHTHSGPGAMPLRRWGNVNHPYVEAFVESVVNMVEAAADRVEPAVMAFGRGVVPGICDNRRRDRGNVVDEELPVLAVFRADATPVAILYNYSCHPVAAHNDRNLISADFPGYAAAVISERFGGVEPMFTLGAAGDVNPVEFHSLELAESYGATIGTAVVDVVQEITAGSGVRPITDGDEQHAGLDAVSRVVKLPVAPLPSADWLRAERDQWAEEAKRIRESGGPESKVEDALIKSGWAAEALEAVEVGSEVTHLDMEITALCMGKLAIVAMPGELFVEIGMRIKEASPFALTAIVELANGSLCYLPTSEAYEKGGYETEFSAKVYGLYMLTAQTQEIIERAAAELLGELAERHNVLN